MIEKEPPSTPPFRWSMRAYIRPGVDLKERRRVCRMYVGIRTSHLEQSWLKSYNVRVRKATSTSILLEEPILNVYWLFTRCVEV
jgi:hypothetical protein